MIVSLGESLIDRILPPGGGEAEARIGGSPYNVAIALARLGVPAGYLCPLSTDAYGDRLHDGLVQHGVRVCVSERVDAPTAIAEVRTDDRGHPAYTFHREGTADRCLNRRPPVDALPVGTKAVHFGSLTLAQADDWPHWRAAIQSAKAAGAFVALDPNLRPPLIDDMSAYCERLDEAVAMADWVKASDEDLAVLHPGIDPADAIQRWRGGGRTVVLTEGARGAQLWTAAGHHAVRPVAQVGTVVDTVGAGDTFQAAVLAWLWHADALRTPVTPAAADGLLAFATRAAALNCVRPGCQPPTREAVIQLG